MKILSFIIMAVFLAFAGQTDAKVYKWVDAQGKVHFVDDPSRIPKKSRVKATPLSFPSDPRMDIEDIKSRDDLRNWFTQGKAAAAKRQGLKNSIYQKIKIRDAKIAKQGKASEADIGYLEELKGKLKTLLDREKKFLADLKKAKKINDGYVDESQKELDRLDRQKEKFEADHRAFEKAMRKKYATPD